nr:MAG TPA: hypothetical protein [Caudoviricetes sp.]
MASFCSTPHPFFLALIISYFYLIVNKLFQIFCPLFEDFVFGKFILWFYELHSTLTPLL